MIFYSLFKLKTTARRTDAMQEGTVVGHAYYGQGRVVPNEINPSLMPLLGHTGIREVVDFGYPWGLKMVSANELAIIPEQENH